MLYNCTACFCLITTFSTHPVQPVEAPPSPAYDPYAGMKTPGQRQLICLQERVKVGEITVDEAVQEFKAWQFDHERRSSSIRYQQVDQLHKLNDLSGAEKWSINWLTCVICALFFFRKIWRDYETASRDVTKRERRQERSLVESFIIWIFIMNKMALIQL